MPLSAASNQGCPNNNTAGLGKHYQKDAPTSNHTASSPRSQHNNNTGLSFAAPQNTLSLQEFQRTVYALAYATTTTTTTTKPKSNRPTQRLLEEKEEEETDKANNKTKDFRRLNLSSDNEDEEEDAVVIEKKDEGDDAHDRTLELDRDDGEDEEEEEEGEEGSLVTIAAIHELMGRLPLALQATLRKHLDRSASAMDFVRDLPCIRLETRLGFEMTLGEFKESLQELLSASRHNTPEHTPDGKQQRQQQQQPSKVVEDNSPVTSLQRRRRGGATNDDDNEEEQEMPHHRSTENVVASSVATTATMNNNNNNDFPNVSPNTIDNDDGNNPTSDDVFLVSPETHLGATGTTANATPAHHTGDEGLVNSARSRGGVATASNSATPTTNQGLPPPQHNNTNKSSPGGRSASSTASTTINQQQRLETAVHALMSRLGPETRQLVQRCIDSCCCSHNGKAAAGTRGGSPQQSSSSSFDLEALIETLQPIVRPPTKDVCAPHLLQDALSSLLASEANYPFSPPERIQTEVDSRMRPILVDWLVDVATRFGVHEETLHLSVNCLDRYLGVQFVSKREYQLAGIASLLIAAKYEEVFPPELKALEYMAAHAYPKEEILRMERNIFVALKFRVTIPSYLAFAHCILAEQDPRPSIMQRCLVSYILDAALHSFVYAQYRPSLVASAAVYIARIWCEIPTPDIDGFMDGGCGRGGVIHSSSATTAAHHQDDTDHFSAIVVALMKMLDAFHKGRYKASATKFTSMRYQRVHALPLPKLPDALLLHLQL